MTETIYKIEIGDYRISSKFSQINSLDAVENFLAAFKDAVRTIHEKHNQLKQARNVYGNCTIDYSSLIGLNISFTDKCFECNGTKKQSKTAPCWKCLVEDTPTGVLKYSFSTYNLTSEDIRRFFYYDLYDFYMNFMKKEPTKSNCFITTATIFALQKDDNCIELNLFRNFRDTFVKSRDEGIILDYYKIAPVICDKINQDPNHELIYNLIWENYLSKCLLFIENGKLEETFKLYKQMVEDLKIKYNE